MTVTIASPGEAKGVLNVNANLVPQLWTTALTEAFNKMAIFKMMPYEVNVSRENLMFNPPHTGFSMTAATIARYESVIAKVAISYLHKSFHLLPPCQLTLHLSANPNKRVNQSCGTEQHYQFLQALESVDIQKPMFPAKTGGVKMMRYWAAIGLGGRCLAGVRTTFPSNNSVGSVGQVNRTVLPPSLVPGGLILRALLA